MRKSKLFILISAITLLSSSCASLEKRRLEKAGAFSHKSEVFFQKAVQEYQKAQKASPENQQINLRLAKLYFNHADYEKCANLLLDKKDAASLKLLAVCFYQMGDFTSSLSVFNGLGALDDAEYLFYYAKTCEKQNLFDQAKKLYEKIKAPEYQSLIKEHIQAIDVSLREKELLGLSPEVGQLINNLPNAEDFPQAGALVAFADEQIEILPNDTQVFSQHYIIKILNERGKGFAEVDIDYDSTFERVELDFARTIKPDGEIAVVGKKHIRDVSRYLNFPLYSNARALIISMPEAVVGSIIEYKLKITRSQLVDKKEFYNGYFLQNDEPILSARFRVAFPQNRNLNLKYANPQYNYYSAKLEPIISTEADKKIYSWEFNGLPQIIAEPLMPPLSEIDTLIIFSTFQSWEKIHKWWWGLAKDKIYADEKMKLLVLELTKGLKTDKEKARSIYNWCTKNIRYVAIEYGQAGFEPHQAADIFANKYGDCKDQAILFISLLKEAGIKAYPVLIGTKESFKLQEDFPAPLFNHAIAAVEIEGEGLIFADTTAETATFGDLPPDDQDRKVLVIYEDKAKIIKTPDFDFRHNRVETKTNFKINPDETVSAEREVKTKGFFDQGQRFHLRYTQPIIFEEGLKEKINSIVPGGKLKDYKINNLEDIDTPIELIYSFSGPDFLTKAGGARVIPQLGSIELSLVSKDSREYPIDFGSLSESLEAISFELPENMKVKFLPQTIKFNTKWISYANSYDLNNSQLFFKEVYRVKQKIIPQNEYRLFKTALERLSRKIKQCVVLEQGN